MRTLLAVMRNRRPRRVGKTIAPASSFRPASHIVAASGEGRVFLLDTRGDRYYGLDDVGAAVWSRLAQGLNVADIAEGVATEYEVDRATAERDVRSFLGGLEDARMIERA